MSAFAGQARAGAGRGRVRRSPRVLATALALTIVAAIGAYEALAGGHRSATLPRHTGSFKQAGLLSLPESMQAAASQAIGAQAAVYRVRPALGGFVAAGGRRHLRSSFTAAGVSVAAGPASVHLRLLGAGYGEGLRSIGAAAPQGHANRVSYSHPGLLEWYVNGPLGLEQGFTLERPPATRDSGVLRLALALSGDVGATLARDGRTIELTRDGRRVMRYTGLSASDAHGRALHSWLSLDGHRILLHVDTHDAAFPVRVDPLVQEEKLSAEGEEGEGHLGERVALSSDGNTALVGAPRASGSKGAAFVFTRTGSVWKQQGPPLKGSESVGASFFGYSVALSANGNTAMIGGPLDNSGAGAAWTYTRSGSTWTQQGTKLTASEEVDAQANFGTSVALSGEGNIALVGARAETVESTIDAGAAWAFTRSGEKWSQQGPKIIPKGECCSGAEGGEFGFSIALSAEGNTALIAAPIEEEEKNRGAGERGSVYAFTRSGESWSQQGSKIIPTGEIGEGQFGESVALSSDGNTALVGAPWDNNAHGFGPGTGAAWFFTRAGKKWSQQGEKLTGGGESGREAQFGKSVALSSNGQLALIGGPWDTQAEENLPGIGAAWEFTLSGKEWTQEGEKLTARGESGNGEFGASVALSADGKTALLGAPLNNGDIGGAWAFVSGATVSEEEAREVTKNEATLHASVNPNGEEVTSCVFEYGTTTAYGSTAECSPAKPGSGESPVAVSAALSKLGTNTTYYFRLAVRNAFGTSYGTDQTFTTLATFASDETTKPTEPAKATDGALSVEGSGGTGKVTIGPYGGDVGGLPLARSKGPYFQIYRSTAASFTTIAYKDCELDGARAIWWDDPATGWEPIAEPVAVYTESPTPCITVTATETTKPSIAQLSDPRHVGGPSDAQEYGKCELQKHGRFGEGACMTPDEKNGKPKGSFEWLEAPAACFPLKHGRYADSACQTPDVKKEKPKGKYELGSDAFTSTTTTVKLEGGAGTLECQSGSGEGRFESAKAETETVTYHSCKRESTSCASAGATAGTIRAEAVETVSYSEDGKFFTDMAGDPIMRYLCGATEYTVSGEVAGEAGGDLDAMSTHSEAVFKPGVGFQGGLTTQVSSTSYPTTLTTTVVATSQDPAGFELSETSKQPGG
jgi:FG-GAP repeat